MPPQTATVAKIFSLTQLEYPLDGAEDKDVAQGYRWKRQIALLNSAYLVELICAAASLGIPRLPERGMKRNESRNEQK